MRKETCTNEYIKNGDYTILHIHSDTHGDFDVLIDNDDVERCKQHKWYVNRYKRQAEKKRYYIVNGKEGLLIHRFIMNVTDRKQMVDHIEGTLLIIEKKNFKYVVIKRI